MNSKEKRKVIICMICLLIIIAIGLIYTIYSNRSISYASSDKVQTTSVHISNAEKVNIEEIIENNVQKIKEQIITEQEELEYITEYKNNKDLPIGVMQVQQEGRTGIQQITIKRTYDDQQEYQDELINSIIIKAPVNKIVEIGTAKNKVTYKITKGSNAYITSDRADIMREDTLDSSKITTLSKNTEIKVLDISDNWCKISVDGQVGWVKSENLTSLNPNESYPDKTNTVAKLEFNMTLNKPSGLTLEQFQKVLTDSKDTNKIFSENAEYFYYIEKQYNINGLFVAAIGIHESAWGTSKIAQNKKNLFGYGAYDSSPYSSSYSFTSYSEGIDLIARVLVKHYLNPNGTAIYGNEKATGKYYNGATITGVNQKYATDKNWANKVYSYMEYLYKKI